MEGMYGLQSPSSRGVTYAPPPPPPPDSLNMLALQLQDGGGTNSNNNSYNNYQNYSYHPLDANFSLYDSSTTTNQNHHHHHHHNTNNIFSGSSVVSDADSMVIADGEDDDSRAIRTKIASHPLYPKLLEAYIECQKVGAPPEIAGVLDAIRRESNAYVKTITTGGSTSSTFGADPELDEFMETYCDILVKYKLDLSTPFEEAMSFLSKTENQLLHLCKGSFKNFISDEGVMSSEEDLSSGEIDALECMQSNEDRELKDKLLQKYSGYISALKQEFSKKKKKGKLPKESREMLLNWWNIHYKWPYPTEADKVALAESTGLDQKQINNWFINQRKRHWKPSENMQFGVMESLYGPFFMSD